MYFFISNVHSDFWHSTEDMHREIGSVAGELRLYLE